MSWDIFVQDYPAEAMTVEDIPDDFEPKPIGNRSEIIEKIKQAVPFVDFSKPEWGVIDGDGFSIEINLGDEPVLDGFALHIRGNDLAIGIVAEILNQLQLRGVESGDGDFFKPESAELAIEKLPFGDHFLSSREPLRQKMAPEKGFPVTQSRYPEARLRRDHKTEIRRVHPAVPAFAFACSRSSP